MEEKDKSPRKNVQISLIRANDYKSYYSENCYIWVDENMIQVEFFSDKTKMPAVIEFDLDEKGNPIDQPEEPDFPLKRERTIQCSVIMTLNNVKDLITSLQETVKNMEEV